MLSLNFFSQWATAELIKKVGCDNVKIDCGATDVSYILSKYTDGGTDLAPAKQCLQTKCGGGSSGGSDSSSDILTEQPETDWDELPGPHSSHEESED